MLGADFMALEPSEFANENFFVASEDVDPAVPVSVPGSESSIWKLYNDSIKKESETDTRKRVKNFKWRIEHGNTLINWHTAHMRRRQAVTSINVPVPTSSFDFASRKPVSLPPPVSMKPPVASQSMSSSDFTLDPLSASFGLDDNSFQLDNIPLAFNALEDPILAPENAFCGVDLPIHMHTNNDLGLPGPTSEPIRDLLYRDERTSVSTSFAHQQSSFANSDSHYPYHNNLSSIVSPEASHILPVSSASDAFNSSSLGHSVFDTTIGGSTTGTMSPQNWSDSPRRPEAYTSPNVHQITSAVTKQNRKKKQFQSAKLVFGDLNTEPVGSDPRVPHFDMHELLPNDLMALDSPIPMGDSREADNGQFKGFGLDFWQNLPTPDSRRRNRPPVSRGSAVSLTSLPGSSNVSRAGSIGAFETGEETDEHSLFNSPVPLNSRESSTQAELAPRTAPTKPVSDKPRGRTQEDLQCDNCKTFNTPLWRRDDNQNPLCNACGLFYKLHGTNRPLKLKTDVIKRRNRQLEEIPVRRRRRRAPKSRQVRMEERAAPSKPIKISPKPSESPGSENSGQSPHSLSYGSPSGDGQFKSSPLGPQF